MPIYICKQCGNLTETEETDKLFCSNCGASLGPAPPQEKPIAAKPPPPTPQKPAARPVMPPKPVALPPAPQKPAARPAMPPKPAAGPSGPAARGPSEPEKEEELSVPERTAESPPSRPASQKTEISLDSAEPREPAPSESTGQEGSAEATPTVPALDVYEDKELVICPTCGYGCNVAWPTCPICGAQIAGAADLKKITNVKFNKSPIDENLVQYKCGYYCDPNWGTCPICP